jgi:hypothetical protein
MPVNYPPFTEQLFSYSAIGVGKETTFRTPVTPTGFTPFTSNTMEFDPALFSPQTMIGVRSTQVYNLSGEQKAGGAVGAPLYAVNGVPLLGYSVGADAITAKGVYGVPQAASGTTANAGTSTSFAATGVTSIALTGIVGTFAVGQSVWITGTTDAALYGSLKIIEVVRVTAFSTPTLTVTATRYVHTGTVTVTVVGDSVASGGAALSSSVTVQTGHGAYFTNGDYITIDSNVTGTSESRHITGLAGDVITVDTAFVYSHAANATIYRANFAQPFLHTITLSAIPPSITVEKNVANVESLIFAGARVGKATLNAPMGNNACHAVYDIMASAISIQASPTAVTTDPSPPFIFKEATLSMFGTPRYDSFNAQIVLDNKLAQTWTYTGSGLPTFNTATDLEIMGKFDAVWKNFDDVTYGDYLNVINGTEGDFNLLLQHATDNSFIYMDLPAIKLSKPAVSPSPAKVAISNLTFRARYNLSTSSMITLVCGMVGVWLPF